MFMLFIGGTELSKVPGVSAAGANPEVIPLTAPADADVIRFGRSKISSGLPLDPQGHPTPAIITRAAVLEAAIPLWVVRAGSYLAPSPPYIELNTSFSGDPRLGPALPQGERIREDAAALARQIEPLPRYIMIAESIPGGTTTALLLLRALGYREMVSSAGPENPVALKEAIWQESARRLGLGIGGLAQDPVRALLELGDPMQAAVSAFVQALPEDVEIILAGGTQMLAVAALLKALGMRKLPLVATTRYVYQDASSGFTKLAEALGVKTWIAQLDFSHAPHPGLRDYERGYIKEGAGAGGSALYAERRGVPIERIIEKTNELYCGMMAAGPASAAGAEPPHIAAGFR
jgi:uncharacterized protein (TIGR00303 family)